MRQERQQKKPSCHTLGRAGEQIAEQYLISRGCVVEARNWRAGRSGEIDLIAVDHVKKLRLFVEVKTRRGHAFGIPAESVTEGKQARLRSLAEQYLAGRTADEYQCRFDVIAVQMDRDRGTASVEYLENAF